MIELLNEVKNSNFGLKIYNNKINILNKNGQVLYIVEIVDGKDLIITSGNIIPLEKEVSKDENSLMTHTPVITDELMTCLRSRNSIEIKRPKCEILVDTTLSNDQIRKEVVTLNKGKSKFIEQSEEDDWS